jgi:myogenesis-regulating glycosidase
MSARARYGKTFRFPSGEAVSLAGEGGLGLAFLRGGGALLETDRALPFVVEGPGSGLEATALLSSRFGDDGLSLEYATNRPGLSLALSIRAEGGSLRIELDARGEARIGRIGFNFAIGPEEHWFGADVLAASAWPLSSREVLRDPFLSNDNQTSPIWLSSRGVALYLAGYEPLGFRFEPGERSFRLYALGSSRLRLSLALRRDAREAFLAAMEGIGRPRTVPPYEQFSRPSFNTWIQFLKSVNQAGIEAYFRDMEAAGFSCGVFMIDDKWTRAYGDLSFDPVKFPSPRAMIDGLHRRGVKVALWVTPFVDEDSERYPEALSNGYLVQAEGGGPYRGRWWNGDSSLVDLSLPAARDWFLGGLRSLARECGADGYKLDAGDARFLGPGYRTARPMNQLEYTDSFASLGAEFPVNELRVSWLTQRLGLVQRLRDKAPSWSREDGLASLLPHGLALGLLGYPYLCADMIGGGWDAHFLDGHAVDEELFVRWTQASALLPIMQFSYAPWRLTEEARAICLRYARLHETFAPYIYERAAFAAATGMPIAAALFLAFPEDPQAYLVSDEFMLGDRYLVAPVLEKGARSRDIYLPPGAWRRRGMGAEFEGGAWLRAVAAPLEELPIFERIGPS